MNIVERHIGVEAWATTIQSLETSSLLTLSLVSNDWWMATWDELHFRRLQGLTKYFPYLENGWYRTTFRDIHIDHTFIFPNALFNIGRLIQDLSVRQPCTKHPSYDCIFDPEMFDIASSESNKRDAAEKSYNTMYFILGFSLGFDKDSRNTNLRNVCITVLLFQYCLIAKSNSVKMMANKYFRASIASKVADLEGYMKNRYLPPSFKTRIKNIVWRIKKNVL
jgi:hypothetical protein